MPFLVDGHNLIPKLGLSLGALDDEEDLIARLNEYSRLARQGSLEVYFDNAPPGMAATRKVGQVTAHFVRRPQIADEAIRLRLRKLGRTARNWSVVSSDRQVQTEAHAAGAVVVSAEAFAATVIATLQEGRSGAAQPGKMSAGELNEWLALFRERSQQK